MHEVKEIADRAVVLRDGKNGGEIRILESLGRQVLRNSDAANEISKARIGTQWIKSSLNL